MSRKGRIAQAVRPAETLSRTPLPLMSVEEFVDYSIVLCVQENPDVSSPRRLLVCEDSGEQFDDLRDEVRRCMAQIDARGAARADLEQRLLIGLLSIELQGDAAFNRLPGGRPTIIVRQEAARRHGVRSVLENAYRCAVMQALQEGRPVHPAAHQRLGLAQAAPREQVVS